MWDEFLEMRGIDGGRDNPGLCRACDGLGVQTYGSTATWRGGIGGQALTLDVCDRCWGSGLQSRPWPSHRITRSET